MVKANSRDRVLAVLDLFTEAHPQWSPEELMNELGYTRPTLYRYLKSLKDSGFLMPTRGGRFALGPRVVEMDYLSRRSDPLIATATPHLERLTAAHPCTALIVRWYGDKILCVASIASAVNPVSSYPRGRPMPMGRGAIARSIMAFLPKQRVMPLVTRYAVDLRSIGVGDAPDDILAALKRVRRAGVAVAFGEVTPGAVGIAAPILDAGYPTASLCITIAGQHANGELIDRISSEVREAARQISDAVESETT
ncbi:IclR family transcriptional regulator [Bradyrhizobium sp. GCM10027634]|uniref:IclR family transcriptional regulator n=1 Tax=unclassified Bradyrhizobium TaxID=2631580 RepID=UPI00188C164A|nr:IclR family transcriptional regulator [Bradyrhizobium sp. WYCCWR 12677]MDN5001802.1 IclR family transcriptional regulator [Bradyrhizobium sp. WYCCWR 12677]QOZ45887.1 IclR family transcriptional regulator [Bradyrhizobium sp. CCBAU 53340]